MKKILIPLLPLVALLAMTCCQSNSSSSTADKSSSATETCTSTISLKEAFSSLSNIQNISVTAPDYNLPVVSDFVENGTIAAGYNMNASQVYESATEAFAILNKVPLTYMINGGNNNNVAAFVYTEPNDNGSNDILIAAMSGSKGSVVFMYGTVNDICKSAIQNAKLEIQGDFLSLEADSLPDVGDFNIILSKAR